MHSRFLAAVLLIGGFTPLWSQPGQPPLTASQLADSTAADADIQAHRMLAALPLYERLAKEVPQNALFAKRLAMCLLSSTAGMPVGPERLAALNRAKAEAKRAQSLGDQDSYLQYLIERDEKVTLPDQPDTPTNTLMKAAEVAFSKGDLDIALGDYMSAAKADPTRYEAPLFAGDIFFRRHDIAQAAVWFQKAIDIDPNRETAYRYWGDTLYNEGKKDEARDKFIDAVIANPYERLSWAGLVKWANGTNTRLRPPTVPRPPAPTVTSAGDGKQQVSIPTATNEAGTEPGYKTAAWLAYQVTRSAWQINLFKKTFPNEKSYRHSLAEETAALRSVLESIDAAKIPNDQLDPSFRDLRRLGQDNMLEPFVLLNAADNGIAQDYARYRQDHRDQLHAYITKYIIHPPSAAHNNLATPNAA